MTWHPTPFPLPQQIIGPSLSKFTQLRKIFCSKVFKKMPRFQNFVSTWTLNFFFSKLIKISSLTSADVCQKRSRLSSSKNFNDLCDQWRWRRRRRGQRQRRRRRQRQQRYKRQRWNNRQQFFTSTLFLSIHLSVGGGTTASFSTLAMTCTFKKNRLRNYRARAEVMIKDVGQRVKLS